MQPEEPGPADTPALTAFRCGISEIIIPEPSGSPTGSIGAFTRCFSFLFIHCQMRELKFYFEDSF